METFADDEATLDWALNGLTVKPKLTNLRRLILDNTASYEMETIVEVIREETYKDILDIPYLVAAFSLRNMELNNLAGIDPNQVRCGAAEHSQERDEIDTVLKIARANLEILLSLQVGCSDNTTGTPIGHLLKAKQQRSSMRKSPFDAFTSLKELSEVPDLAAYVIDGPTEQRPAHLHDIVTKRNTRDATQFRERSHEQCRNRPNDITKEYVKLLHDIPLVSAQGGKVMRFLITNIASAVGSNALRLAASVIDSFLVDLLRKRNPKYFIEDLRQVSN